MQCYCIIVNMWIEREIRKHLEEALSLFPIVMVAGARQVGKSSLLLRLFPYADYVTLDDPELAAQGNNNPREFLESLNTPAIIDEAQYAPELFRYLKIFVDKEKTPGQYILTGSQQFSLMQHLSESLAGRGGIVYLYSLSALEILHVLPQTPSEKLILQGGFPEIYANPLMKPSLWFPSYMATYLERDVRNILKVSSLREFNTFMRALALRTGQILSLSGLARDIGVAPNTIKSWLSVLETSQHITLLKPYFNNQGKRLVKSPKLYFNDSGLAAYLMGLRSWDELKQSPLAGAVWETFVFSQILKHFANKGELNPPLYFWRTSSGEEIDFILERAGRFTGIECKFSETAHKKDLRGFTAFRKYYGEESLDKCYLACRNKHRYSLNSQVDVCNFLGDMPEL